MVSSHQEYLNRGEALPRYYGEDRLVILARDPYSIFAYWEISAPTRERLKQEWGEERWEKAAPQMRIHKHERRREGSVESFYDIALREEADNWYIPVLEADRAYHAELGWRFPEGEFKPLLRSNTVHTPRDGLSDVIDEEWRLPDWKARKLYRRISLYHLSSPELFRRRKQRARPSAGT